MNNRASTVDVPDVVINLYIENNAIKSTGFELRNKIILFLKKHDT